MPVAVLSKEDRLWALKEAALLAGYEFEQSVDVSYVEEMLQVQRFLLAMIKELEDE